MGQAGECDGGGDQGWFTASLLEGTRPTLLGLLWIHESTLSNLKITNPILFCNNVDVFGLTADTVGTPNGDGIDPDSSTNVLIEYFFW